MCAVKTKQLFFYKWKIVGMELASAELIFHDTELRTARLGVPDLQYVSPLETHQFVIGRVGVIIRVWLGDAHGHTVGENGK